MGASVATAWRGKWREIVGGHGVQVRWEVLSTLMVWGLIATRMSRSTLMRHCGTTFMVLWEG